MCLCCFSKNTWKFKQKKKLRTNLTEPHPLQSIISGKQINEQGYFVVVVKSESMHAKYYGQFKKKNIYIYFFNKTNIN